MARSTHGSEASRELKAIRLTLAAYAIVFIAKLAAYFATGVIALLAEALHTLSDIFISGFLLLAAAWSARVADEEHAFGHGRAQNVAALVAATMFISFTSFRLYEEAIPRLFSPGESGHQNLTLALVVIAGSMLVAAVPLVNLGRGRATGAAARAQLLELINDELGLLAALVGTLLIGIGYPIADPAAAIVVATIIAVNAFRLLRENASFLLGQSPGAEYLARVRAAAMSVNGVLAVTDLRAEYVGPESVHAGMHIEVDRNLSVVEADEIAEEVKAKLHELTGCQYCVIHVDPWNPQQDPNNPPGSKS